MNLAKGNSSLMGIIFVFPEAFPYPNSTVIPLTVKGYKWLLFDYPINERCIVGVVHYLLIMKHIIFLEAISVFYGNKVAHVLQSNYSHKLSDCLCDALNRLTQNLVRISHLVRKLRLYQNFNASPKAGYGAFHSSDKVSHLLLKRCTCLGDTNTIGSRRRWCIRL